MQRFTILLLMIFFYFLARIPYLGDPLWGEEGMFAQIFLEAPSKSEALLIGRVNGELQYTNPQHPLALYKLLGAAGKIFNAILPSWTSMATDKLFFLLRINFSIFILTILSGILWFSTNYSSSNFNQSLWIYPFALISAIAISPLAITTSVGLQIDASSGILFIGILPVFILAYNNDWINIKFFRFALLIGGFLTGLGKNEWNLAIIMAIIISYISMLFIKRNRESQASIDQRALAFLLLGVLGGNIASFFIDPNNYLAGFFLMMRIADGGGLSGAHVGLTSLEQYFDLIVQHTWSLMAPVYLFFIIIIGFSRMPRNNLWFIFLAVYGSALFGGYIISPYVLSRNEMRYFTPSLIVLLSAAILCTPLINNDRWYKTLFFIAFLLITVPSIYKIMEHMLDAQGFREAHLIFEKKVGKAIGKQTCLPVIRPDQGFRGSFDFVSETIPDKYQEQYSKLSGKPLCPAFGHAFAPTPGLIALQENIQNPANSSSAPLVLRRLGPSSTQAGVGFNIQPDGGSAIWAQGENITSSTIIVFDSVKLHGFPSGEADTITSPVPAKMFANPGIYPVKLYDPITGAQSNTITFQVN